MKEYLGTIVILMIFGLESCKMTNPNTMFKDVDATTISFQIDKLRNDYIINNGDEISLKVYTRKGSTLIEPILTDVANSPKLNNFESINFLVSNDGIVNFPIIGSLKVAGLTESYLKNYLEKEFEKDYQSPFVVLKVENRRAFVFKGTQGSVISLNRTPTSIFEVLAKAGGLDRNLKSSEILIIRGDLKNQPFIKSI